LERKVVQLQQALYTQKPLETKRLESQINRERALYIQKTLVTITNGEKTDFVKNRFEKPINVQKKRRQPLQTVAK